MKFDISYNHTGYTRTVESNNVIVKENVYIFYNITDKEAAQDSMNRDAMKILSLAELLTLFLRDQMDGRKLVIIIPVDSCTVKRIG